MKFFDADTWKTASATTVGIVSCGYAAARDVAESVALKTPSTGYDMFVARATALAFLLYIVAKFLLVVKNRNKKEGD